MQDNQTAKRVFRRFTVEEANAMLPLAQSIAADIQEVFRSVTGRRADLHRLLRKGTRTAGTHYDDEMAESRADLQEEYERIWHYREELESLGVLLRNPEEGAIEFPTLIMGQEAFLCWQIGEAEVHFWRNAATANSKKQPLSAAEQAN